MLLSLLMPALAQAQFTYTTTNGTVTITRYTGVDSTVSIPETLHGLPVTGIAESAFYFCVNMTNVAIPKSVTAIGDLAFYASGLANVTIPDHVTDIGASAFYACRSLTVANLGKGLRTLGGSAFWNCASLTRVTLGDQLVSLGSGAFTGCSNLTSVNIPNSVTSIEPFAFCYCVRLASVTMGNSVTSIGESAFARCKSLTRLIISPGVASLGAKAFEGCAGLTDVYFGGNAPTLDREVFYGATRATIYYSPATTGWGADFGGRPTRPWNPVPHIHPGNVGMWLGQYGFTIEGTNGLVVVVESCADLAQPRWSPLGTNTLDGGSLYFSDPQWTHYSRRFYRVRWP